MSDIGLVPDSHLRKLKCLVWENRIEGVLLGSVCTSKTCWFWKHMRDARVFPGDPCKPQEKNQRGVVLGSAQWGFLEGSVIHSSNKKLRKKTRFLETMKE